MNLKILLLQLVYIKFGDNIMFYDDDIEDYDNDKTKELKCWSCDKWMTYQEHSENDGFCIHCNNEIELDD